MAKLESIPELAAYRAAIERYVREHPTGNEADACMAFWLAGRDWERAEACHKEAERYIVD